MADKIISVESPTLTTDAVGSGSWPGNGLTTDRGAGVHVASADRVLPFAKQAGSEMSPAKLLDAAAELISEGGYERMTMAAIGKRAGYSHGLVTARFGSKEGLLWALVDRMVNEWRAESLWPSIENQSSIEVFLTMI